MTIAVKVIADSEFNGARITTMHARYPRFIHSELMTHRMFSRNSASSRAIPFARMIDGIKADIAMPVHWGREKRGMQAGEQVGEHAACVRAWEDAAHSAIEHATQLHKMGLHKQVVNRVLEPFVHMDTLITATQWQNFFDLRCHPDADPTMQALACAMRDARDASIPQRTSHHAPYLRWGERVDDDSAMRACAARCCRISYGKVDGGAATLANDLALAERLEKSGHWSPFEHVAFASFDGQHANLYGWRSLRMQICR